MRRLTSALQWLVCHGFVAGCFLLPMAMGVAYEAGTLGFEVDEPPERTAHYMASMSLIPFPDPDEQVREITEELMKPPGRSGDASEEEGSESPLEANTDKGEQEAPKEGAPQPTEEQVDRIKSGGKTKGPTQDGEGSKAQECLPDNPDIKDQGDDTYRVKREMVDHYVNHLRQAATLADTFWQKGKGGEIIGFRVRRVRCGNDLYQLGFRGGDVVLAVNGETVTSVAQAIGAYRRLRKEKVLEVTIRRNQVERVLKYTLY
ncbi:MAG TPA: hypothetical protein QGF58_16100 [Myxococcota bacterium]|nr:hypothetical protein [Myxococcota bacterium]